MQGVAEIRSLGDFPDAMSCLPLSEPCHQALAWTPFQGVLVPLCQGGTEWDSLWGGVLPKLPAFRTLSHPCPLLEASQGGPFPETDKGCQPAAGCAARAKCTFISSHFISSQNETSTLGYTFFFPPKT